MKNMKKISALLVAALLVLAMMVPAFADDPEPAESAAPTNNRTLDTEISVSNLETGDKVDFYQVLVFNSDATTTGGWSAGEGFAYDATDNPNGLKVDDIQKILGLDSTGKPAADLATNASAYGIDEGLAARIADLAESATAKYPNIGESNGTAKVTDPAGGLYVGLVKPAKVGYVYNPVFMGADYVNNTTNTVEATLSDSYSPASMAKKSVITVEKTASTTEDNYEDKQPETVAAGDTVTFTIETTIPEFGNNYTSAVFKVTDVLTAGLELKTATIKVYKDSVSEANLLDAADTYADGKEYKLTTDTSANDTFTVDFWTQYILGLTAAQKIVIQYDATVTNEALTSINIDDNTVTVNYSNEPTDETGKGKLKDETKHYTFDIDANLLGKESYHNSEVVKVGVDENGNELTETRPLDNGNRIGALEGAEFALFTDSDCKNKYTNTYIAADSVIVSDVDGRLTVKGATVPGIRGLDVGTYYLKETKAPDGYIKAQEAVKIEIYAPKPTGTATSNDYWELKTYTDETDASVTWNVWELKKYEVKINNVTTASYTMTNEKPDEGDQVGNTNVGDDATSGKIKNTKGTELPSTGGMGTTILYVAGSILVLGAVVLMITRRRVRG